MQNPAEKYSWSARVTLFAIVGGVGLLLILSYAGVLHFPRMRSNRRAIFSDPHHWQILSIGIAFFCAGASFVIPSRWKFLGVLCSTCLVVAFFAGIIGSFMIR